MLTRNSSFIGFLHSCGFDASSLGEAGPGVIQPRSFARIAPAHNPRMRAAGSCIPCGCRHPFSRPKARSLIYRADRKSVYRTGVHTLRQGAVSIVNRVPLGVHDLGYPNTIHIESLARGGLNSSPSFFSYHPQALQRLRCDVSKGFQNTFSMHAQTNAWSLSKCAYTLSGSGKRHITR